MKKVHVLLFVLVLGASVAGVWFGLRSARASSEEKDAPGAASTVGRFQILPRSKDAEADDLQMLDTATGKLYGLHRLEKVKDKAPAYEWYLLADTPK